MFKILLTVAIALLAVPAAIAGLTPLTGEFTVNATSAGRQDRPVVVATETGSFAVFWRHQESELEAVLRRLVSAQGVPLGQDQEIEPLEGRAISRITAASDPEGRVALAWAEDSFRCVAGKLLAADGTVLADLEPVGAPFGVCGLRPSITLGSDLGAVLVFDRWNGTITGSDVFLQAFSAQGQSETDPLVLVDDGSVPNMAFGDQAFAALSPTRGGRSAAAWVNVGFEVDHGIYVRTVEDDGETLSPIHPVRVSAGIADPDVAIEPTGGRLFVVWAERASGQDDFDVLGRILGPDGEPLTDAFLLSTDSASEQGSPAVAMDGAGRAVVAWRHQSGAGSPIEIHARQFDRFGTPVGPETRLDQRAVGPLPLAEVRPRVAVSEVGTALVTWASDSADQDSGGVAARLVGLDDAASCSSDGQTLCLRQGRFRVRVGWHDPTGGTGNGTVVPVGSDRSGLFWFFHPDNWELMVKVLDGCSVNGHYWVFAAATTNVEYTLTVVDTLADQEWEFSNPLGRASPAVTDTRAFETCP